MNEADDLVKVANDHLSLKYRPLPEGWKLHWVDTPSSDTGFVVCLGKFEHQEGQDVLVEPEIRGEGATIKDAIREAVRQVRERA